MESQVWNETILQVLMRRDGMSKAEAEELIEAAKEDLQYRLSDWPDGDGEDPFDICRDWFGLEEDYVMELI